MNEGEVGPADAPPGRWNPGSLHQHFSTRLNDIEKQVNARLNDLDGQLDRRIKTQERERADTERHLTAIQRAGDEKLEAHIQAQREAVAKSESNIEKRLYDLNRVRDAHIQDRSLFATREALDARFETIGTRISTVEDELISRRGAEKGLEERRGTHTASTGLVVGIVTAAVAVLGLMIALANALTG